ncbi:HAD hydrolase family protein [Streptomyces sp. NPDC050658]|uniref:HAD hydrolase family protein n=1 Tax=unclassified Streptomyces TaxID=2593676 RepID=UPI00342B1DE5
MKSSPAVLFDQTEGDADPRARSPLVRDGWKPGLLALDVDGTLVAAGGQISDRVRNGVLEARRQGATVVMTTGRSLPEASMVLDSLGMDTGYLICSNGSVTAEYPSLRVISEFTFSARSVVELLLAELPTALIAADDPRSGGYVVSGLFPEGELLVAQRVAPLRDLLSAPVCRVIVRDPHRSADDFLRILRGRMLDGVSYAVGYTGWLDLTPRGVTKASALSALASTLALGSRDCLAIGDGRNDKEMLAWAGRGVAMGQAPDEVKDAADAVIGPVTKDGVAQELALWFSDG